MPFFRKKPVVIEAVQLLSHNISEVVGWCERAEVYSYDPPCVTIHTLEGDMRADHGDMIIKGVNGEFYPCKPDIFAKTYEPAGSPENTATSVGEGG